jgi:DNA-binding HxlR family transcriptional regulator
VVRRVAPTKCVKPRKQISPRVGFELNGPKRTCELENQIVGISLKVLIEQLRVLEEHGLVSRETFPHEPQRVDYGLTPLGMSLKPLLSLLEEWGQHHAEELQEAEKLLPCAAVVRNAAGK